MFAFYIADKLHSISLGFTPAFVQSDLKREASMEVSLGYNNPNGECVLKIKKTIHGLSNV